MNTVVRHSQNPQAVRGKNRVAVSVIIFAPCVRGSITFNNEAGRVTEEVSDKAGDDLLTAKVQTAQTAAPQAVPEHGLCVRHFPPHLPRQRLLFRLPPPPHNPRVFHNFAFLS